MKLKLTKIISRFFSLNLEYKNLMVLKITRKHFFEGTNSTMNPNMQILKHPNIEILTGGMILKFKQWIFSIITDS